MQGSNELVDASATALTTYGPGTAKATIGVSAAVYTYFGLPLSDWVAILTGIFLLLQIITILPKATEVVKRYYKGITQWLQQKKPSDKFTK